MVSRRNAGLKAGSSTVAPTLGAVPPRLTPGLKGGSSALDVGLKGRPFYGNCQHRIIEHFRRDSSHIFSRRTLTMLRGWTVHSLSPP
jgi:hypothetical protein